MTAYADTSFLACLYLIDIHSPLARGRMTQRPSVWLTPLQRAEYAHVIAQQVFQRRISSAEANRAYDDFENDRRNRLWLETPLPEAAFELGIELTRKHVTHLGCRTLDTLHIASALELGATMFWTFDQRQKRLAKAVGLAIV